jgi:oxalate---CoA ligase
LGFRAIANLINQNKFALTFYLMTYSVQTAALNRREFFRNDPHFSPASSDTIVQLLQSAAMGSVAMQTAIVSDDAPALTYQQLWQQVTHIAQQLQHIGIKRQDTVAVVLPNGPAMAIAFLAVTRVATCAPLNPGYRTTEFEFYLTDLDAKALIVMANVDSEAIAVAEQRGIAIVQMNRSKAGDCCLSDGSGVEIPGQDVGLPEPTATDVALVLHTSGTTARPKIVPLTHGNLWTSAQNVATALRLTSTDRALNIMPLFHIHGLVGCLLATIVAGGSVICAPGFVADRFLDWLIQLQPTWYSAVPTLHQAILEQITQRDDWQSGHSLRLIRSSSSALPPQVMAAMVAAFQVPIVEAYGMTEAAHQMTCNPLDHQKPGSVGRSAGPEVAIMDAEGQMRAVGELGEVVIRGTNVTSGYTNNPIANQTAFTDGWFRTGDQGYLDADGYLFLNGRLKEIINRGGEKISPQEVDNVLMQLPQIRQAVTFAVAHPTLGEDVVAAVVLHSDRTISPTEIRQYVFERLAGFKVPSQIVVVDAIPKGPTGKLQRIGLADRLAAQLVIPTLRSRYGLETQVAEILAAELNQETIGVDDNFFLMGGDSLRGIGAVIQINDRFGLALPPPAIFEHPTVAALSRVVLEEVLRQFEALQDVAVTPGEDEEGHLRLVIYGVSVAGRSVTGKAIKQYLQSQLGDITVPYTFLSVATLPEKPTYRFRSQRLTTPPIELPDNLPDNPNVTSYVLPSVEPNVESNIISHVAPRIELERRLVEVCERVLVQDRIGVEDDLRQFRLGEFPEAALCQAIEKVCGTTVTPQQFHQTPTVAKMAERLLPGLIKQHQLWELDWNPIEPVVSDVPIDPVQDISQLPVFILNGGFYGLIAGAYHVAQQLGQTRPCYSIHARGLDGKEAPHTRIEEMAAEAIEGIRQLQPQGPYFLIGLCTGGTVAFEIAQQLRSAGESIGLLALVHTAAPKISSGQGKGFGASQVSDRPWKLPPDVEDAWRKTMPDNPHIVAVAKGIYQAQQNYRAQPYAGKMVLFQPQDGDKGAMMKGRKVWQKLAVGGLQIQRCAGDDMSMYAVHHLHALSAQLQHCLDQV